MPKPVYFGFRLCTPVHLRHFSCDFMRMDKTSLLDYAHIYHELFPVSISKTFAITIFVQNIWEKWTLKLWMDVILPGKICEEYMEPAYAPNNYELVPVLILNRFSAFRQKFFFQRNWLSLHKWRDLLQQNARIYINKTNYSDIYIFIGIKNEVSIYANNEIAEFIL